MTNDCKTCPVSTGTHKPAEALQHISEPQTQQPDALRLLQEYRKTMPSEVLHLWANDACDAMFQQHARIAELEDAADIAIERIAELEGQLEAIGAGGVEPLRKPAAAPQAVQAAAPTDDELTMAWIAAGGVFFGPNTPTGSMPEAKLFPFLRRLSAPAHPAEAVPAQAEPFMWAIQEPGGSAYMDENCVSTSRGIVEAEVDGLNLGLDADDEPYKVVPVYLAATQPAAQDLQLDTLKLARDRLADMLEDDDGQAWKEARKAMPIIDAALAAQPKQGGDHG